MAAQGTPEVEGEEDGRRLPSAVMVFPCPRPPPPLPTVLLRLSRPRSSSHRRSPSGRGSPAAGAESRRRRWQRWLKERLAAELIAAEPFPEVVGERRMVRFLNGHRQEGRAICLLSWSTAEEELCPAETETRTGAGLAVAFLQHSKKVLHRDGGRARQARLLRCTLEKVRRRP